MSMIRRDRLIVLFNFDGIFQRYYYVIYNLDLIILTNKYLHFKK